MTGASRISVVLVSYDSAEVLAEAIASVPPGAEVIVVDNASADDSADVGEAAGASVIRTGQNAGFGTGCNRGAAMATREFILFLNPDARLEPDCLERLLAEADSQRDAAAFGPVLLDGAGQAGLPRAATLLDSDTPPMMSTVPEQPCDVGFLSGAAFMVRTAAFRDIGGFDENIFLYLEDDDLCLRLRGAGGRLRLVPGARVTHHQGTSSPPSPKGLEMRNRETMRSLVYLAGKHGIGMDFAAHRRKARWRLLIAALLFDRKRVHINRGRLQGLSGAGRNTV